jgi:hypothetical protein
MAFGSTYLVRREEGIQTAAPQSLQDESLLVKLGRAFDRCTRWSATPPEFLPVNLSTSNGRIIWSSSSTTSKFVQFSHHRSLAILNLKCIREKKRKLIMLFVLQMDVFLLRAVKYVRHCTTF